MKKQELRQLIREEYAATLNESSSNKKIQVHEKIRDQLRDIWREVINEYKKGNWPDEDSATGKELHDWGLKTLETTIKKYERILKKWDRLESKNEAFDWRSDAAKGAKEVFNGEVWVDIKSKSPYFFAITGKNKADLYKFIHGVENTDKPFVERAKSGIKIDIPRDKDTGTFEYKGITFSALGNAAIHRLKDGSLIWEY